MTTDEKQNELLFRLDERQKSIEHKIDAILTQTTKTNGRLTKAEDEIQKLNIWQSRIKGSYQAVIVIGTVVSVVIGWVLSKV